jgi:hypothetical protein
VNPCRNILLVFLSLVLSSGVLFLFVKALPPQSGEGMALLSFDESEDDTLIAELLVRGGWDGFYAESNQELYINDFGTLSVLPLWEYQNALEHFDPRRDAYGEKLHSFFVQAGKRFFFVPLENTSGPKKIQKDLQKALDPIPFELEILGRSRPLKLYFLIMAVSALLALAAAGSTADRGRLLLHFPLFFAFAWAGPPGFVLAAVLSALGSLLKAPLSVFFPLKKYGKFFERLKPYRFSFYLVPVFIILFSLPGLIHSLPPAALGAALALFLLVELVYAAIRTSGLRKAAHLLFEPVPILETAKKASFARLPTAIFAAGCLAAFLLPSSGGQKKPALDISNFTNVISKEDYQKHVEFQSSFFLLPLGNNSSLDAGLPEPDYLHYQLDSDGLIAGPGEEIRRNKGDITAFPLEKLLAFLVEYTNETGNMSPARFPAPLSSPGRFKDWLSVVLLIIICVPGHKKTKPGKGRKGRVMPGASRRIAA